LALVFYSRRSKHKATASQVWPATSGTMLISEINESVSRDENGDTSTAYYPNVVYTYQVSGQTYTCKQVAFGGAVGRSNPAQVQPFVAKYPVGAVVTVYYNPNKPEEAVLEKTASGGANLARNGGIFLLIISALIGCVMLFSLIRNF